MPLGSRDGLLEEERLRVNPGGGVGFAGSDGHVGGVAEA